SNGWRSESRILKNAAKPKHREIELLQSLCRVLEETKNENRRVSRNEDKRLALGAAARQAPSGDEPPPLGFHAGSPGRVRSSPVRKSSLSSSACTRYNSVGRLCLTMSSSRTFMEVDSWRRFQSRKPRPARSRRRSRNSFA